MLVVKSWLTFYENGHFLTKLTRLAAEHQNKKIPFLILNIGMTQQPVLMHTVIHQAKIHSYKMHMVFSFELKLDGIPLFHARWLTHSNLFQRRKCSFAIFQQLGFTFEMKYAIHVHRNSWICYMQIELTNFLRLIVCYHCCARDESSKLLINKWRESSCKYTYVVYLKCIWHELS